MEEDGTTTEDGNVTVQKWVVMECERSVMKLSYKNGLKVTILGEERNSIKNVTN